MLTYLPSLPKTGGNKLACERQDLDYDLLRQTPRNPRMPRGKVPE